MRTKVLFFMALLMAMFTLGTVSAEAASIYCVKADAAGANNGSDWNNAYTALPATLVRGASYYIADGNYSGRTFSTAVSGTSLITIKKATPSDHGTDTGWQSSYGDGQATFSGQLYFASSYWEVDGVTGGGPGSWNTGFGFKVIETGDSMALIKVGDTSSESKYHDITVRHVDLQGKGSAGGGGSAGNDGVGIYGGSSFTLSYAWMHGIGRCPVFGYSRGVNVFEYIYVSSYYGSDGGHSEVASLGQNSANDFTWRYSLITDIKSTGGLMWDNTNNTNAHMYVYGNVFYKPAGANWDQANGVIGGWTSGLFSNVWVYNNTFINVDYLPLSYFPSNYRGNIASNNIYYNCASPDFSRFATHDYNHFINSGGAHSEAHGTSAASGDPFIDYVNLNFGLASATSAGATISSPAGITLDSLGKVRGSDGNWDRGAFEFGGNNPIVVLSRPNAPLNLNIQ
jgi:hypothetical protein